MPKEENKVKLYASVYTKIEVQHEGHPSYTDGLQCSLCKSYDTKAIMSPEGNYVLWCNCGIVEVFSQGDLRALHKF